ncbi:MEKHLA domain-containing protein [uncultured Methylovirgula sp.]|uniref:MEKHLA domain-containing protein n=1 Tax=uncultured Methylovirgula sp. TaxID=1285960 RepID=UPI00263458E3|nr:MEKHLA domain-containing protein [uncultured Methylovirgula sp.]
MQERARPIDCALSDLIISSYRRVVGAALLPQDVPEAEQDKWLYENAPFCVLAHNNDSDPLFIYANEAAQRCFEYSLEEFLVLPSRLSAEAPERLERQRLLDSVARNGFAAGYTGVRVAKSGRRFWIENGIVWQLIDDHGAIHGQAATFNHWRDV